MAEASEIGNSFKKESEKFKKKTYWEERYENEDNFDWFCELSSFEHLLFQHLNRSDRVLNLGCGNSRLSASLHEKGYHDIVNIDFSENVISKMKKNTSSMPSLEWYVMDMLDLKFDSGGFDVVLDKGSIDSLMVDQGDVWNPKQEVIRTAEQALSEAFRVLKVGGHFLSVTFSQPHFRGPLLYQPDKFAWTLSHWCIGETFHYFFFVATKRGSKEVVLNEQGFDYSYSFLYNRTQDQDNSSCPMSSVNVGAGDVMEGNSKTVEYCEDEDENFLLNIGDIF